MTDFFIHHLWSFWCLLAVLFLIAELTTGTLYLLCLALGAVVATLAALLGLPFYAQLAIYCLATAISVFFIRPFKRASASSRPSNVDALIGKEGTLISDIGIDKRGYVKIDGDEWPAKSHDGQPIKKDTRVRIIDMDSIIAIVCPV